MKTTKFAILGAGNGGHAFSGHLSLLGYDVTLFDIDASHVERLRTKGSITLEGALEGEGAPRLITNDIADAVDGADIVMVVVPACYHESLVALLAPHVQKGQVVVLNPGATGGALSARRILREHGHEDITVAETTTLVYACRALEPGKVRIHAVKDSLELAALPKSEGSRVVELLREPFPAFSAAPSVLHTSFSNVNAMAHPGPTILNLGRIESGTPFYYYREGLTPSVASIVERLDGERLAAAEAYGVHPISVADALRVFYGVEGDGLYDAFQKSEAHAGLLAPESADTRYIFEDIPTGLVPLTELGRAAGVETPTMRAIIDLGCGIAGKDFWSEGRTLEKLGLAGMSVSELQAAI